MTLDQGRQDGAPSSYVLTVDAVRAAIVELRTFEVADYFPAYLHLHAVAATAGSLGGLRPNWREFADTYLAVEGDGSGRPYFRPFREGDNLSSYWMNPNVAGSWAPSSLRSTNKVHHVVEIDGRDFALRAHHEDLAREFLLNEQRLPVLAVAGFLYRDFAFEGQTSPTGDDLVRTFREDFGFPQNDAGNSAFDALFVNTAVKGMEPLFQPWTPEVV